MNNRLRLLCAAVAVCTTFSVATSANARIKSVSNTQITNISSGSVKSDGIAQEIDCANTVVAYSQIRGYLVNGSLVKGAPETQSSASFGLNSLLSILAAPVDPGNCYPALVDCPSPQTGNCWQCMHKKKGDACHNPIGDPFKESNNDTAQALCRQKCDANVSTN